MKRLVVLAALAACGRVGFDPLADGTTSTSSNSDGRPGDGPIGDSSTSTSHPDGSASACSIAVPVGLAAAETTSTCNGGTVTCGMGTQSAYFVFTAPASAGYQFAAYDHGTMNVSSSTAQMNATCTALEGGACAGILGLSLDQNETIYLSVTANSGCEMIDFTVTSNGGG